MAMPLPILRLKYGTIDYEDIMEFTDHILAQNPAD